MAVPSIPALLVKISLSPALAPAAVTYLPFSVKPMMQPTTIGLAKPGVDSQCPPTMAMPKSFAALCIWVLMVSTILLSAFSGSIMHEKKKAGSTPKVATSLAFTFMASQPMRSTAPVIGIHGDDCVFVSKIQDCAVYSCGWPKVTSLRAAPRFLKTTSFRMSMGIFPGGSFMLYPLLNLAFKLWENSENSMHDWHGNY